ncbi:MAG: uroporphyrinogen decarboxylase family protein [Armatimonadota bacterium]
MTPRQRMLTALEGGRPDRAPVAPYIWGAEYLWKLLGVPIWVAQHGAFSALDYCAAIQRRHDLDWVIPLGWGDGFLEGKQVSEEAGRVLVTGPDSGRRWEYLRDGHRLVELGPDGEPIGDGVVMPNVIEEEAPRTTAEVDDWFERTGTDPLARTMAWAGDRAPAALRDRFPDHFLAAEVGAPFHPVCFALGFETALVMLHETPAVFCYMSERFTAGLPALCQWVASNGFDAGMSCDSWASADIISPDAYRDWIAPLHRHVADELHRAGVKAILYNTGNVLPFLRVVKEMGWDAISVEERIKGVEIPIGDVRTAVGPRQCLFGNFDAYALLRGDREEIESEVHRQFDDAGRHGAFVMGTGSPICDGTDPEVVDFWLDAVHRVCRYE